MIEYSDPIDVTGPERSDETKRITAATANKHIAAEPSVKNVVGGVAYKAISEVVTHSVDAS